MRSGRLSSDGWPKPGSSRGGGGAGRSRLGSRGLCSRGGRSRAARTGTGAEAATTTVAAATGASTASTGGRSAGSRGGRSAPSRPRLDLDRTAAGRSRRSPAARCGRCTTETISPSGAAATASIAATGASADVPAGLRSSRSRRRGSRVRPPRAAGPRRSLVAAGPRRAPRKRVLLPASSGGGSPIHSTAEPIIFSISRTARMS